MNGNDRVTREIARLTSWLQQAQSPDGAWRFCFESGPMTDAYMIILLRTLNVPDENLIKQLAERISSRQQANGAWKLFDDEPDGNLSATVESYYALLCSGDHQKTDPHMQKAKRFILSKGGLAAAAPLTKVMLSLTGQYPWRHHLILPVEIMLLPPGFPISLFDFVGYTRVHLVPILVAANRRFAVKSKRTPDLSDLDVQSGHRGASGGNDLQQADRSRFILSMVKQWLKALPGLPRQLHHLALRRAERFMLDRIEPDGTLYSYASATFLMVFALLALGYSPTHPVIGRAIDGLKSFTCQSDGHLHLQNCTSTVWDTALLSDALQESGMPAASPTIRAASRYLLSRQHTKYGDWAVHNRGIEPGGWGFSDSNTINPDVDDTTAALRAISRLEHADPEIRHPWQRALRWVVSMQNADGGWAAFEKNTNKEFLTWLPYEGFEQVAIDPSTADLTGRTLEFLGNYAGLDTRHPSVQQAVHWLTDHQEADGSWYGRWGICYIYGTWAAVTGMLAAGVSSDHPSVRRAVKFLVQSQNPDGGWGESCRSDAAQKYIPLGASTLSQTAWAVDALIAAAEQPTPEIERGIRFLIESAAKSDWTMRYPTGAGLPGGFYIHYHSYRYIWPLLALSHYKKKFSPSGSP